MSDPPLVIAGRGWPDPDAVRGLRSAGRAAIGRRHVRRRERLGVALVLALALHAGGYLGWSLDVLAVPETGATRRAAGEVLDVRVVSRAVPERLLEPAPRRLPLEAPRTVPDPVPLELPPSEPLAPSPVDDRMVSDAASAVGRLPGFPGRSRSDRASAELEPRMSDVVVRAPPHVAETKPATPASAEPAVADATEPTREPPAEPPSEPASEPLSDPPSDLGSTTIAPVPMPDNPSPRYPAAARRRGHEGLVVLRAEVDASGTVTAVEVARSSGHASLDAAAREVVLRWSFHPATEGQRPVAGEAEVSIRFQLEG